MSAPQKPIRVLLCDDNARYADSFKNEARNARIITDHVDNVDDVLERINGAPKKYLFLVLDAKAYQHEGEQEGDEDEMNLMALLPELEKLKSKGIDIPYCVNTGFADFKVRMGKRLSCPVFEKGQEEELFKHIWDTYNSTDYANLRRDHPIVFDLADDYFDEAALAQLTSLLTKDKYKSSSIGDRVDNLARLRRTAEHLMDILHAEYLGGAAGIVKSDATRAKDVIHYIKANEQLPTHVFGFTMNLYNTASNYGTHNPMQAAAASDYPSGYALSSLTEGLLEMFVWAKGKLPAKP